LEAGQYSWVNGMEGMLGKSTEALAIKDNHVALSTGVVPGFSKKGSWYLPLSAVKKSFRPLHFNNENAKRTVISFFTDIERDALKQCAAVDVDTDLTFEVQRKDSETLSTITYWRLDTFKLETFLFNDGLSPDLTRVKFDGTTLTCQGNKDKVVQDNYQCNYLRLDKAIPAIVFAIDFNPRSGTENLFGQYWRNKYTLKGTHYSVTCKKD
jgi:hypothetical protein